MTAIGKQWRQFQGQALFVYFRLITQTARWQFTNRANLTRAKATGRPILWALWHGQTMPFIMYGDRFENGRNFCVITVGDDRSDTLTTLGTRLGADIYSVNMQGNPMAAGRAVLRVIQAMKRGKQSMIAPDGPDGPAFVAKAGVAVLAQKSGGIIVPVGAWTRQAYQLNRWDDYLVPSPFARIHIAFGKPILPEPETSAGDLLATITNALHTARDRARQLAGIND